MGDKVKAIKPITIELGISDTLLIMDGLNYIIKDMERHVLDKELAKSLKDRIKTAANNSAIEIERGE